MSKMGGGRFSDARSSCEEECAWPVPMHCVNSQDSKIIPHRSWHENPCDIPCISLPIYRPQRRHPCIRACLQHGMRMLLCCLLDRWTAQKHSGGADDPTY